MCIHTLYIFHEACGHVSVAPRIGLQYTLPQKCEAVLAWIRVYHDQPNKDAFDIPMQAPRPCPLSVEQEHVWNVVAQKQLPATIGSGSVPNQVHQSQAVNVAGSRSVLGSPSGQSMAHPRNPAQRMCDPHLFPPRQSLRIMSDEEYVDTGVLVPWLGYWHAGLYFLRPAHQVEAFAQNYTRALVSTMNRTTLCPACIRNHPSARTYATESFGAGWMQKNGSGTRELVQPDTGCVPYAVQKAAEGSAKHSQRAQWGPAFGQLSTEKMQKSPCNGGQPSSVAASAGNSDQAAAQSVKTRTRSNSHSNAVTPQQVSNPEARADSDNANGSQSSVGSKNSSITDAAADETQAGAVFTAPQQSLESVTTTSASRSIPDRRKLSFRSSGGVARRHSDSEFVCEGPEIQVASGYTRSDDGLQYD